MKLKNKKSITAGQLSKCVQGIDPEAKAVIVTKRNGRPVIQELATLTYDVNNNCLILSSKIN